MDRLLVELAVQRRVTADGGLAGRGAFVRLLRCLAIVTVCAMVGCGDDHDAQARLSPLHRTFSSPEALGDAVLAALAARDVDTLSSLALDELEFRTVVWPELPSSRPERGVPFDYAWGDLHQKSTNSLRRLLARYGGERYELVGVRFEGETTPYETYRVHRETFLALRDEEGNELTLPLFGSILERDGEFKLFSYVVD